mmetsp:Transcript_16448/g.51035  ORF Transcript_16448/g.51035 Transcript_16448/m.51035 type:complete len:258 (-) Transcript_16448:1415-2188(-)
MSRHVKYVCMWLSATRRASAASSAVIVHVGCSESVLVPDALLASAGLLGASAVTHLVALKSPRIAIASSVTNRHALASPTVAVRSRRQTAVRLAEVATSYGGCHPSCCMSSTVPHRSPRVSCDAGFRRWATARRHGASAGALLARNGGSSLSEPAHARRRCDRGGMYSVAYATSSLAASTHTAAFASGVSTMRRSAASSSAKLLAGVARRRGLTLGDCGDAFDSGWGTNVSIVRRWKTTSPSVLGTAGAASLAPPRA